MHKPSELEIVKTTNKQADDIKKTSDLKRCAKISVTLFYYPAYKSFKHFFGHMAVTVDYFNEKGVKQNTGGFSNTLNFGGSSTLDSTEEKFGKPIIYQLPPPPKELTSANVSDEILKISSKNLSVFSNNCTDAAVGFLKKLGYDSDIVGMVSLPSRLAEKIEKNYSLETTYNAIMNYISDSGGQNKWTEIKTKIQEIFAPAFDNKKLKENAVTLLPGYWKNLISQIEALREKYSEHRNFIKFRQYFSCCYNFSPPESYKKLTELLEVVKHYANPAKQANIIAKEKAEMESVRSELFSFTT